MLMLAGAQSRCRGIGEEFGVWRRDNKALWIELFESTSIFKLSFGRKLGCYREDADDGQLRGVCIV